MSAGLKLIELQVALPRTQTAGKMQEQIQQRNTVAQDQLAQQQIEEDMKKNKTITETENIEQKRVKSEDESTEQGEEGQERERQAEVFAEKKRPHPYKGKHIDITW